MFLALALFIAIVVLLTWMSRRAGIAANGCCAPADPNHDLRMRTAADDTGGESGPNASHLGGRDDGRA